MNTVKFAKKVDQRIIDQIVERAVELAEKHGWIIVRLSLSMGISAVHANGCPLRLKDFLKADSLNFAHDMFGIQRHLDRKTGKLENCFLPRFAQPKNTSRGR
ncbi:MAG: hypothetical protein A2X99_05760 [Deltaproteobacteria bacterium GWB2_55_19]|nr:MAG: hypothetical protein A2X99_05760 [Deltaproteobacteria bacterium GWB2_55_19]